MSRRKQAKPRSLKPGSEGRSTDDQSSDEPSNSAASDPGEPSGLNANRVADPDPRLGPAPGPVPEPEQDLGPESDSEADLGPEPEPQAMLYVKEVAPGFYEASSPMLDDDDEDESDAETLGTDQGSSWRSDTPEDAQTSPAPSSCATPNSATDLPDAELTFTVGTTEATPYACQFCDKAFPRLSFLKKHEQTHSDQMPFRCEFCSRLFKHKRSRDRHIKLHTGDKKYRCTQCEAAFSRSDHLKIHMKTHDTQKPYQCSVCNRGYNTAAALTSHMQNHKRRPDAEPETAAAGGAGRGGSRTLADTATPSPAKLTCEFCLESFLSQEQLENHIVANHKHLPAQNIALRALSCTVCKAVHFKTIEELQIHFYTAHGPLMRSFNPAQSSGPRATPSPSPRPSNGGASHPCEMCTMRFSSIRQWQHHVVSVHGNDIQKEQPNPTVCVHCCVPFKSAAAFLDHYVTVHGGFSPSLVPLSPLSVPEQMKPTDLSRKPAISRPSSVDRMSKRVCGEDRASSNTPNPSAQYDHPGVLYCNQCNAALPDFESFRTHFKSHLDQVDGLQPFFQAAGARIVEELQREGHHLDANASVCPHCGLAFKDFATLEQHVFTHFMGTATEYGCPSCMKMFSKPDELQKHLMDIHAHHLYRCSLCKEMFDSKVTIQVHFALKHTSECKSIRCMICPNNSALFHSELEFGMHVRNTHGLHSLLPAAREKTLRCMYCNDVQCNELYMQLHLATHLKPFSCPACPETFQVEFLLDKHIQTHHSTSQVMNGREDSIERDKSHKKSTSNSPHSIAKISTPPVKALQKSSTSDNNNGKKQHEAPGLTNCDICDRNDFSNETELVAHRKLVHHVRSSAKNGPVSLHCAYCNENCKTRTELENHMKSHSQSSGASGKHKCNICDELCPSAVLLAEHKLTHCKVISGNCCTQCKASLTTEEQFYSHLVQHSNNNNGGNQKVKSQVALPSPCVICRQTLISDVEVRIHSQFHLRNTIQQAEIVCSVCLKKVNIQCVIVSKGIYVCPECYAKPVADGIPRPRSFRCNECQLTFDNHAALEKHTESVHNKTYTCIKCQASFDSERDVQIHVTTHLMTEGSSNECHLCRRAFPTPMKLQAHLIEHTFAGCGGFTCYLCSAVFTGALGLQGHILEHGLAARPYDCPQCNLKFFFRAELDNHSYVHLRKPTPTGVDLPLLSPKAYYVSSTAANGDISTSAKESSKTKFAQKQSIPEKNSVDNKTNADSEIKREPEEVVDYKEEFIEVNSSLPSLSPTPSIKIESLEKDGSTNAPDNV